jgi:two-component system heavy metal sensor histidine kinase CusS
VSANAGAHDSAPTPRHAAAQILLARLSSGPLPDPDHSFGQPREPVHRRGAILNALFIRAALASEIPVPAEIALSARRASLSIGAKLTLRYTLAVTVTLTVLAVFVYAQVAHRINREARLLLEVQAQELADDYRTELASGSAERAMTRLREHAQRSVGNAEPGLRLGVELVSADGQRRMALGSLQGDAPPVSRAVLEGSVPELLRAINVGRAQPYLSFAVQVPGGALRVAMDTARYADNVRHVRDVFLLAAPFVLIATALAGWLLARGSLRPIAQITSTAQQITASNLGEAVPQSGSGDELDQLAGTLNDMLSRIQTGLERMRRFNANVAHELRTPLTGISSQIEVTLEKSRDPEEYREVLAGVLSRAQHMAESVDAMLRMARVEAGIDPERRRPVVLGSVLETVVEFFEPVAEESGISLRLEEVPSARLLGDAAWLHQLFSNLVANALRHTPAGGRVELHVREEGEGVRVTVEDTGPGIAPAQLARIFERFERAETSASGGTGLGLPIAREIAHAHGGRIDVDSTPGAGACFGVWLPRVAEAV